MVYPIVIYGHPILRKVAEDIDKDYPGLDNIIADLLIRFTDQKVWDWLPLRSGNPYACLSSMANRLQKMNRNLATSKGYLLMHMLLKNQGT